MLCFLISIEKDDYTIEIPSKIYERMYRIKNNNKVIVDNTQSTKSNTGLFYHNVFMMMMDHVFSNKPNTELFVIDKTKFVSLYQYNRNSVFKLMLENVNFEIK
jgi:hypothetical protein